MSLGIAFKGPEGIVLAVDSRVTLTVHHSDTNASHPAYYDNATKLLKVEGHDYVGAVTYGVGALGGAQPRTAHSYIPEFEREIGSERLSVEDFAARLGDFFLRQWRSTMSPNTAPKDSMVFLVGGFDRDAAYGRVFQVAVPTEPAPKEFNAAENFGITWGGQGDIASRIIHGYDPSLDGLVKKHVHLNAASTRSFRDQVLGALAVSIPYQFLPLQDCVDMAIFLIKATATIQKWTLGVRGVGGAIDVATITRTEGFRAIQEKQVTGERYEP
ncbi:MAG: hypothetical protein ACFB50_16860 [Rubrobacteraceae bacterium]